MASSSSLSRELILARCKTDNLKMLKNLNLWGVGFEDVSILNQMPNLEVLSLSINKISSLKDFQNCSKLQELYVRQNNIKNLAEVRYLQNLPYLRTLWLQENPAPTTPNYRQYVLSHLPNLQKLDNKEVSAEERNKAVAAGAGLKLTVTLLLQVEMSRQPPKAATVLSTTPGRGEWTTTTLSGTTTKKRQAAKEERLPPTRMSQPTPRD